MPRAKHKTISKELKKQFSWLENRLALKVVIGISECARHRYSPGHIRLVTKTPGGYRAIGYTGNGITNFFIICKKDQEELRTEIEAKFEVCFTE